jgi:hypothetical protein
VLTAETLLYELCGARSLSIVWVQAPDNLTRCAVTISHTSPDRFRVASLLIRYDLHLPRKEEASLQDRNGADGTCLCLEPGQVNGPSDS